MVAVAALFIHYLLTPTRRSRGQVMLLVWREPLRIRNRTIAVHFVYVYVLLIRKLRLLIRTTYLYIYTFIVEAARLCLPLNPPIPALLPPIRLHLPYIYHTLSTYTTYGVKPEVRCSAEAGFLYTYIYTYTNYVY